MTKDEYDTRPTPYEQNQELRYHLDGVWSDYKIVKIERIERAYPQEGLTGWRVTYTP